jgi:hypothetical protein
VRCGAEAVAARAKATVFGSRDVLSVVSTLTTSPTTTTRSFCDGTAPARRWPLGIRILVGSNFDMDEGEGKRGRWNTLRAMRVLDWYERGPVR